MNTTALWAAFGIAIGLAGLGILLRLRLGARPAGIHLAGVGPLSRVTHVVIALALLGAGYHVFVYAVGVMASFRAPLAIAIGVAIAAILGSIGVDAIDNRMGGTDKPDDQ